MRYVAEPGFIPNPYGNDANIRLDLGEVIAISPVLEYDHDHWLDNANPPLPAIKPNEWLIEFAAHPDACLLIDSALANQSISLRLLETLPEFVRLNDVNRKVTLRIFDQSTGMSVAAKIHLHGESGDYLAPIGGHRLPNSFWFEDYGTEHVQGFHYSCYVNGETQFKLPLGPVYIEVTKGFEIRPVRQRFVITAETETIEIGLEHVLAWRQIGWVTADTHVHFLSPQTALLEGEAEGVNVVNLLTSQWGEMFSNLGDFDGRTTIGSKEAGGSGEYLVRVGTENRQHVLDIFHCSGTKGK